MNSIPHLALPLRLAGTRLAVVEQDTQAEIACCALASLRTPYGHRASVPDFGLVPQEFRESADKDAIAAALRRDEPRAAAALVNVGPVTDVTQVVQVILDAPEA